jgi:hypothetical protein
MLLKNQTTASPHLSRQARYRGMFKQVSVNRVNTVKYGLVRFLSIRVEIQI